MSIARKILSCYRGMQYAIFGRKKRGVIEDYKSCNIVGEVEEYKKDVVHPCVRYTENEFRGHHWWMVYTPYYQANPKIENPILCYGESKDNEPPSNWHVYKELVGQPSGGYNSDPNLLFDQGRLYVFWRENETSRLKDTDSVRGVFCIEITEDRIRRFEEFPLLYEKDAFEDHEVSPTFIRLGGKCLAFANHLRFKNKRLQFQSKVRQKIVNRLLLIFQLLGFYNQQKTYGIAIWEGKSFTGRFDYMRTAKFCGSNRLYLPWHSDMFLYKGVLYAVVQSNQCNADICLGRWDKNLHTLQIAKKPLVTNFSIQGVGIYKPTAVVFNGVLYVYVTAQRSNDRGRNLLFQGKLTLDRMQELWR